MTTLPSRSPDRSCWRESRRCCAAAGTAPQARSRASTPIQSGELQIDASHREATFGGAPLTLTTREFDLLAHLAANPGHVFTRDQLLARLWGVDYEGDTRTVDVHVSWLRTKLRAHDGHNYFRTVRGIGYAFAPRPEQPEPA